MKAVSTLRISPNLLKELRLDTAPRKMKPAVPSGKRSTVSGSGTRASQQDVGKRKVNELACSGDSMEPANRRPGPGAGSAPLPANSSLTGEQAAVGNRQPGPSGRGETYAVVLAGPVARLSQVGRSSSSSSETTNRRISNDMSGPLSRMPDGTTSNAHVAKACLLAGERPKKMTIFISGVSDTRSFLVWLRPSCPDGLVAPLKGEKLMAVPSTTEGYRAAISALRSLHDKDGVSFHNFTLPEQRCARRLVKNLGKSIPESVDRDQRGVGIPEHPCPGNQAAANRKSRSGPRQEQPSYTPLHCISGARASGVKGAIAHRTLQLASVGGVVSGSKIVAAKQVLPPLRPHAA